MWKCQPLDADVIVRKKELKACESSWYKCDNGGKVSTVGHLGDGHKACHKVRCPSGTFFALTFARTWRANDGGI